MIRISFITLLLMSSISIFSQSFLKFEAGTGMVDPLVHQFLPLTNVAQSSQTGANLGTIVNLGDGVYTTGAQTLSTTMQFVSVDLGTVQSVSNVVLSPMVSAAYLNGAALEVSTDNVSWTPVVPTIAGAVANTTTTYSFTARNARYVRVYRAATGFVGVSEFLVVNGDNISIPMVAGALANTASTLQPIGFSFSFRGSNYTNFSANANGLMRLGTTVVTTENVNNTLSSTNTPKIFALWDDIATGTVASGGGVRYRLKGTAPNRILVVDWKCNKANSTTGVVDLNFQVWLYEGSNKIEYRYGNGINVTSASVGLGGVDVNNFMAVTPNVTPSASTVSYFAINDAITQWPGLNTIYSFIPTVITPVASIPTDGNSATVDFRNLDEGFGALNWAGVPSGGITVNVEGGYTEMVPKGISTTTKMSGLLLRATGTSTKPITIRWVGTGVKPILTANEGIGLNDYVLGFAGSDYITIDGFDIRENPANSTTPNNNKWTEIGIAFFKAQVGTTTVGANACSNNIVKNCSVTLNKSGNGFLNVTSNTLIQALPLYTKGIAMVFWDHLLAGANTSENINLAAGITTGIVSQADVHSFNEFYSNSISDCFHGIWMNDRYKTTIIGKGNIIGSVGQGNTINNYGAQLGIVYTSGTVTWPTHSIKVPKAIFLGNFYDAKIEGNTISNGYASHYRVYGIEFGAHERGSTGPLTVGKVEINNNNINNLFANTAAPAANASDAVGIVYIPGTVWKKSQTAQDSVMITGNTISGLFSKTGKVMGISTGPYYNDATFVTAYYNTVNGPGQTAIISNNTISNLRSEGVTTSAIEGVSAIFWGQNYQTTYITNNQISGLQLGLATTNPAANSNLNAITFWPRNTTTRELVEISGNTIENITSLSAGGTTVQPIVRMIHAEAGGLQTNIKNNTIRNNDFTISSHTNQTFEYVTSLIAARGLQASGSSTLTIEGNSLTNNIMRGVSGGTYSLFNGMYLNNTTKTQTQIVKGNTISNLQLLGTAAASSTQTQLTGIRVYGSVTLVTSNIEGNTITGLSGDKLKTNQAVAGIATVNETVGTAFTLRGISTGQTKSLSITKNLIYNNTTSTSTGNQAVATTASTFLDGNVGIVVQGGTAANSYNINNNFIYDLFAPSLNAPLALTGICIGKQGKFYVDHNTIVLGDPINNTPVTSTVTGSFGVTGILYAPSANSATRPANEVDKYTFRNNIVSLTTTNKGTGATMALRQALVSAVNATPGDVTTLTNNNLYHTNAGAFNYLYGQGTIANITGGIRNAFAYNGATANATYKLVSQIDFNDNCSDYINFMKGAETSSYTDVATGMSVAPPFVGGAAHPGKYFLNSGSVSYAFTSGKILSPTAVLDDYLTNNVRTGANVSAGAHQTSGTFNAPKITITASIDPVSNTICPTNPSVVVTVNKLISTVAIGSGQWAPRLYFKRSANSNLLPSPTQNINTFNGWKWVNPTSVNGNIITFDVNQALIQPNGFAAPQTIEYFVVVADDASNNGLRTVIASGASFATCLQDVDLYASGGNSATVNAPDVGSANSYDLLSGASLTKKTQLNLNGTIYTANNATAVNYCIGDSINITGIFDVTALAETLDHPEYTFELATNATFTTGVVKTVLSNPKMGFIGSEMPSDFYARMWVSCGGTLVASSNTPYIRLKAVSPISITSDQGPIEACEESAVVLTITNGTTGTAGARFYMVSEPTGKAYITAGTTTSVTGNVTFNLGDPSLSGTWNANVGLSTGTFTNLGLLQASIAADPDNQGSSLTENAGLVFTTLDYLKLNSVNVFDDAADAIATTGFKVALYDAITGTKLYETGTQSVTNGAAKAITFTNWNVGPGTFALSIESFDENTPMEGALISPSSVTLPIEAGADVKIIGSSSNNTIAGLSSEYVYFYNLSITGYCTKQPQDDFEVTIRPSALFSCGPTLWLKADNGLSTMTNGAAIDLWTDKSEYSNNAVQAVAASKPTVVAVGPNFNPSVNFNGSNFMTTTKVDPLGGSNHAYTKIAVFNPATNNSYNNLVSRLNGAAFWFNLSLLPRLFHGADILTSSAAGAFKVGQQGIMSGRYEGAGGELGNAIRTNGNTTASSITTHAFVDGSVNIGGISGFNSNGQLSETFVYNRALSDQELLILESYLAIKYGVSLDQTVDNDNNGTVGTSYYDSEGNVIWDDMTQGDYSYHIFGIGRDDISGLHQRQSKSMIDSAMVTIGNSGAIPTSNSAANGNNISTDKSFLLVGSNNADITEFTTTEVHQALTTRIAREWKVAKTGSIGSVKIRIPDNSSPLAVKLPPTIGTIYLLVDNDGDFSSGATEYLMTLNGTNWETNVNLNDGQYFTFVSKVNKPLIIPITFMKN